MELRRRDFIRLALAAAAAALGGAWDLLRSGPKRVVRAVRARFYPGRVEDLDPGRVSRPGRWQG